MGKSKVWTQFLIELRSLESIKSKEHVNPCRERSATKEISVCARQCDIRRDLRSVRKKMVVANHASIRIVGSGGIICFQVRQCTK